MLISFQDIGPDQLTDKLISSFVCINPTFFLVKNLSYLKHTQGSLPLRTLALREAKIIFIEQ